MYNFLFDKRSLTLLLGGLAMGGALLFAAGLLLGVQWGVPSGTQVAAAPRPCPEPIVVAAAAASPPPAAPPQRVPAPAAEPAAPSVEEAPASEDATPEPAPTEPPPAPPAAAAPAPADLAIGGPADGDGRFAVQVGAFANPANSRGMLEALARRGYDAYIVELASGRRVLQTVRFGRFDEHAAAAQAAADFRRKEGMDAVVEESDTL